jgi:GNAT superfamily N-acetyltransferase
MAEEWCRGEYTISTDPDRLHLDVVHGFLTQSYWAEGISREVVQRSIAYSLPFGLYKGARQVGFARIITDRATFAYLADVFVLDDLRGQGLGKWLIETIGAHPDLQGLRRWVLFTRDAHGLYRQFGFDTPPSPASLMVKQPPDASKQDPARVHKPRAQ